MTHAVVRGSGYVLVHAPDMVLHNGTTQTTEKSMNPDSDYLKTLPKHIRSFEEVVSYPPNQTYIGNLIPEELKEFKMPWHDKKVERADKVGKFGEIMPQDEFIGLMKIVDVFDLIKLEKSFTKDVKKKLDDHHFIKEGLISRLKEGEEIESIKKNCRRTRCRSTI